MCVTQFHVPVLLEFPIPLILNHSAKDTLLVPVGRLDKDALLEEDVGRVDNLGFRISCEPYAIMHGVYCMSLHKPRQEASSR